MDALDVAECVEPFQSSIDRVAMLFSEVSQCSCCSVPLPELPNNRFLGFFERIFLSHRLAQLSAILIYIMNSGIECSNRTLGEQTIVELISELEYLYRC